MIRSDDKPWIVVMTGCRDEIDVCERQEIEPVVNDVELVGALEYRGDVQALCDLGVDCRILRPAPRRRCVQAGRSDRVRSGENSVT